jgi:hypothetical protein
MNKKLVFLFLGFGAMLVLLSNCEKNESNPVDNVTLLTNGSSKVWYLAKITTPSGHKASIPSCVCDDEISFNNDGTRIINNMGTIIDPESSSPLICKDTVQDTFTAYWELSPGNDTLTVTFYSSFYDYNATSVSEIISLTEDTLVLNTWHDTTPFGVVSQQTETYYSK